MHHEHMPDFLLSIDDNSSFHRHAFRTTFPKLGHMFYIAAPEDTTFSKVEEVPHLHSQAWPYFLTFIILENIVLWFQRKPLMRINDGIVSMSHGLFQELGRLVFRGTESALYIWIYNNYRLVNLPWNSVITWYIAAIGVDFCYYWIHRACHEIHFLWAQHQVHHSSEDYNLAVGLRQSVVQSWCGFLFYLPLALFVPPAQFLTHQQFNLLYQFWVHTETIPYLGPLEWIFTTPRHHRVHHGSNIWCLDKNYGGTLIIWDRLFGTFAECKPKKKIIFGLVMNQPSFNPIYLQVFYNMNIWNKANKMTNFKDKIFAIIKGPSWLPGKPWTGCDEDKINVTHREKFDVHLSLWCNVYLACHFVMIVVTYHGIAKYYSELSLLAAISFVAYVLGSVTLIGFMLENRKWAYPCEIFRCLLICIAIDNDYIKDTLPSFIWLYFFSVLILSISILFPYVYPPKMEPELNGSTPKS